jgi:hypothetical protein
VGAARQRWAARTTSGERQRSGYQEEMGGDAGARDFVVCGVKSGPVMFVVNTA